MGREFKACRGRICGIRRIAGIDDPADPGGEDVEDRGTPVGRRERSHAAASARVADWRRFVHAVSSRAGGHHLYLHEVAEVSRRGAMPADRPAPPADMRARCDDYGPGARPGVRAASHSSVHVPPLPTGGLHPSTVCSSEEVVAG